MIKTICLMLIMSVMSIPVLAGNSFILDSLDEAKILSKKTNKPVLLIFGADYCDYCLRLKKDLLLADGVEHIICYIDIKDHSDLRDQYNVDIVPDSRIIFDNKEISKFKGYSHKKYFKWLHNAK